MKWIDLTDMLFCRVGGYMFTIIKPQYRNDIVEWCCINTVRSDEDKVVAEGKTVRVSVAKTECKRVLAEIKKVK